ncbi:rCG62824, partial [Rattus norvegicus]
MLNKQSTNIVHSHLQQLKPELKIEANSSPWLRNRDTRSLYRPSKNGSQRAPDCIR